MDHDLTYGYSLDHWFGNSITVLTDEKKVLSYDTALVKFADISDEEVEKYIQTREPYDKAGSYAIQGYFGRYIDHIEGDYENVVGLPYYRLEPIIKKHEQ